MAELAPLLAGGGVFSVLAIVIIYLLKSNRDDRIQFGKEIDDAELRADKAETRGERLQELLDKANRDRREALDREAAQARAFAAQAEEIEKLRTQIEELTAKVESLEGRVT